MIEDRPAKTHLPAASGCDRFRRVLARTIVLLNDELAPEQVRALADASAVICWEFPDVAWQAWLVVSSNPPALMLAPDSHARPSLTVIMDSTVLHAAAIGETSLGIAFLAGRLQVRGLTPLFLAKFVKLVDPLLRSYRAAVEELHERAA